MKEGLGVGFGFGLMKLVNGHEKRTWCFTIIRFQRGEVQVHEVVRAAVDHVAVALQ